MEKRLLFYCVCATLIASCLSAEQQSKKENKKLKDSKIHKISFDEPKMLPVRIEKQHGKVRTDDILRHMGMTKMKNPAGNSHRKRLAASRPRHDKATLPDSHVYVIKLPPNKFYYEQNPQAVAQDRKFNRIPVSFKSNGKPGKIYHWNLPLVKKNAKKQANQILKWAREEKAEGRRVSYFKPKTPSNQAFHKYFPGNGKPHSIYVIERSAPYQKNKQKNNQKNSIKKH